MDIAFYFVFALVIVLLIVLGKVFEKKEQYRCRVFELTNGKEGSNLIKVEAGQCPPPPRKDINKIHHDWVEAWREELCAHYRTDLQDVKTEWHVCKVDDEGKPTQLIALPADIALRLFAKLDINLYRKIESEKQ